MAWYPVYKGYLRWANSGSCEITLTIWHWAMYTNHTNLKAGYTILARRRRAVWKKYSGMIAAITMWRSILTSPISLSTPCRRHVVTEPVASERSDVHFYGMRFAYM